MRVKEAIVLAGGLGTRLKSAVADLPKCMAPVDGKPFLHYLITYLQKQGIERIIFSLGYLADSAANYIKATLPPNSYVLVQEPYPLGTGGAIQLAIQQVNGEEVWVLNSDSLCNLNLSEQAELHFQKQATCTLGLVPMEQFDRYGVVTIDNNHRILGFEEKKWQEQGLNTSAFQSIPWPEKFSMETDFLQAYHQQLPFYGFVASAYFLDIGIPEDYQRAQQELPKYSNA
jgi:D-glycero-alpha-D-manno-heptose 1-phosphate guanylyltransferase